MSECRCRTETVDYLKKCIPAFRHSGIYIWFFQHHIARVTPAATVYGRKGVSHSTISSIDLQGVSLSTASNMDVNGLSISTASSMDVQGVSLSAACCIDVQGVSFSTTSSMDVQGVSFRRQQYNVPGCIPFRRQLYGHPGCIPFYHQQFGRAGCTPFHQQLCEHTGCIPVYRLQCRHAGCMYLFPLCKVFWNAGMSHLVSPVADEQICRCRNWSGICIRGSSTVPERSGTGLRYQMLAASSSMPMLSYEIHWSISSICKHLQRHFLTYQAEWNQSLKNIFCEPQMARIFFHMFVNDRGSCTGRDNNFNRTSVRNLK